MTKSNPGEQPAAPGVSGEGEFRTQGNTADSLAGKLLEKEKLLFEVNSQVTVKDQKIAHLIALLQEKEEANHALNSELVEIKSSSAWSVIQLLWRVRRLVIPSNSARERAVKGLMQALKGSPSPTGKQVAPSQEEAVDEPNSQQVKKDIPQSQVEILKEENSSHLLEGTSFNAGQDNWFWERGWNFDLLSQTHPLPVSNRIDIIICVSPDTTLAEQCIDSIRRFTDADSYRLHLVIHKLDRHKLSPKTVQDALIIEHSMDVFSFSAANNLALRHCQGDVVLLNDDTEVTPGWLENLKHDSRGLALTGARTGYQCSGNPDMWGEGAAQVTNYPINMFCAFIPKRVRDVVGELDEEFNYYGGDDVDYSCRALLNGFPLVVSSAFVHHKGNRSYGDLKTPLMLESDKILLERYQVKPPFLLNQIKPLVSVIIATRNRAKMLPDSVNSILGSLYTHIEVIIVDDASSDPTWEVIGRLQTNDRRIIGIKLPEQSGPVAARQRGIDAAKGAFIVFHDDDDAAWSNRISGPLSFMMKKPEFDIVYGGFDAVTDSGRERGSVKEFDLEEYLEAKIDIGSGTFMIRKNLVQKVPFMSYYDCAIDYDWVFRIIRRGYKIGYYPQVVLDYNRRGPADSHLAGTVEAVKLHRAIQERERLVQKFRRKL